VRRLILIALHAVIGIGGVAAGFSLTVEPSGADVGLEASYLDGSPFADYLIPGLCLLLVIGPSNLVSGFAQWRRHPMAGLATFFTGVVLLVWIGVQWTIIGYQDWTQVAWTASFILLNVLAAEGLHRGATIKRGSASGPRPAR
jgi:hypothetical protein